MPAMTSCELYRCWEMDSASQGNSSACSTIIPKSLVTERCGEDGFGVRTRRTVDRRLAAAKDREELYSRWCRFQFFWWPTTALRMSVSSSEESSLDPAAELAQQVSESARVVTAIPTTPIPLPKLPPFHTAAVSSSAMAPSTILMSSIPKTSHTTIKRRYHSDLNARIQSLHMAVPALRVLECNDGPKAKIGNGGDSIDIINERGCIDGGSATTSLERPSSTFERPPAHGRSLAVQKWMPSILMFQSRMTKTTMKKKSEEGTSPRVEVPSPPPVTSVPFGLPVSPKKTSVVNRGELGYKGAFTIFERLYKTAVEHRRGLNRPGSTARSDVAGVSFKGMEFMKAQHGVGWLADRIKEALTWWKSWRVHDTAVDILTYTTLLYHQLVVFNESLCQIKPARTIECLLRSVNVYNKWPYAPLRPAAFTTPSASIGSVLAGFSIVGEGKKSALTNDARYLPIKSSPTVIFILSVWGLNRLAVFVSSKSGALVLVGRSSVEEWIQHVILHLHDVLFELPPPDEVEAVHRSFLHPQA
ncbi:hypothetical protein EV421DRAFT_1741665 [Armillaria borealis]|uniref:Uncharacterized protein n=1 Tax=Armillaria borealis TaxID=47425 RepID=A0AA39IZH4_9AGAR|nr:hypothetical protein EV421DRAFT_1741665 [Armillaria borealis]